MTDHLRGEDKLGADGDMFYAQLLKTHEGLSEAQSHALNARLVLLMANQIASYDVLASLLQAARDTRETDD